jgi:ABC-2 type transport system permease protein
MMRNARAAVVIGYMLSITWIRRNILSIIWLFATPFSILFILTVATGGKEFAQGIIGSIIFVLVGVGTNLAGDAAWFRIDLKLQDYFVASSVSEYAYLLGIALAGLFFSIPALLILFPLLIYAGLPLAQLPLALIVSMIIWLISASIGYLFSTYMPNARNGWQLGTLLAVIIGLLPPVFYRASILPQNLLFLSYFAPTTHASMLLSSMMGNTASVSGWNVIVGWALLVLSLIVTLAMTAKVARWRQA